MSVSLWFCPEADLAPGLAATLAAHWLDVHEQETATRFLFERDRRRYLVAHTLLRRVLALETGIPEAEADLRRPAHGRPFLQPPAEGLPRGGALDFSLSRTHAHTLVGVARGHRIGVDVEHTGRGAAALESVAEGFARTERDWIARVPAGPSRTRRALRLWTLRQAYAKARGLGLGPGPAQEEYAFTRADEGGPPVLTVAGDGRPDRWRFLEFEPAAETVAAVAVETGTPHGVGPPAAHLRTGFPWGRATPRVLALT
ncbi:4'-phosphopantetheinyl transferase family protein [Streptomyces sp. NPDC006463]|uniref:4'-phosphopantetheinyl transferase family protein n=1 Tax=Streptomyces sp. NPDC006463 TaxID=3364746 RepID=UPI0036C60F23